MRDQRLHAIDSSVENRAGTIHNSSHRRANRNGIGQNSEHSSMALFQSMEHPLTIRRLNSGDHDGCDVTRRQSWNSPTMPALAR
jgi:hypothetical protein